MFICDMVSWQFKTRLESEPFITDLTITVHRYTLLINVFTHSIPGKVQRSCFYYWYKIPVTTAQFRHGDIQRLFIKLLNMWIFKYCPHVKQQINPSRSIINIALTCDTIGLMSCLPLNFVLLFFLNEKQFGDLRFG